MKQASNMGNTGAGGADGGLTGGVAVGSAAGRGRVALHALCQLGQAQAGVCPELQEPGCGGAPRPRCCLRRPIDTVLHHLCWNVHRCSSWIKAIHLLN